MTSRSDMNNKTDDRYWPEELIVPMPSEFAHGDWVHTLDTDFIHKIESDSRWPDVEMLLEWHLHNLKKGDRDRLRYECHTQCCLVGFAALAFDEPGATPSNIRNPATAEFLHKFIEFSGVDTDNDMMSDYDYNNVDHMEDITRNASEIFETGNTGDVTKKLSPRRAHNLWKKTAAHFGYDVDNLKE